MPTLSKGAAKLRTQMNTRFPNRDTSSDGWIGDTAHAARQSDHNPDRAGIVHAIDIDADFGPPKDDYAQRLVNELIACAKAGKDGGRLKYVIHNRKIWSRTYKWLPRMYDGTNPHTKHIHVSVTAKADTDGKAWPLPLLKPDSK